MARTNTVQSNIRGFTQTADTSVVLVVKAADETVNNNDAFQNDDELFFSVNGGELWYVTWFLRVSAASATPDIVVAITDPPGSLTSWWKEFNATSSVGAATRGTERGDDVFNIQTGVNDFNYLAIHALVKTKNAGTILLQWAQDVAHASDTIVKAGSHLLAWRN